MKLTIDRNMPYAKEAFSTLGEVLARDGRQLTAEDVRDAEALFTRSTTKVNADLLHGSAVRFYGSAVIGTDHIDIPYLEKQQIPWVAAPGCNAESVANYVTSGLLWLGGQHRFTLKGKTMGIIGCGNVGSKVLRHAKALGLKILVSDPPKQRSASSANRTTEAREIGGPRSEIPYVSLPQLLAESDIVTCHVPLTKTGPDATYHMLAKEQFEQMKPGVIFINAARGPVIVTDDLLAVMGTRVAHVIMDCWEGEPAYRTDLLARVDIATPHIAGHSYEGKVNGTKIVYKAYLAWLLKSGAGLIEVDRLNTLIQDENIEALFALPPPPVPQVDLSQVSSFKFPVSEGEDLLRQAVLRVYDIEADSLRLKRSCVEDPVARAAAFDQQRSKYPMRREFTSTTVTLAKASPGLCATLQGLGFKVGEKE
jgi:erythronate-4-phosphate dehydrogenase